MQTTPTLDFSRFISGSPTDKLKFAKDLIGAEREFGIAALQFHPIRGWTMTAAQNYGEALFGLPEKRRDEFIVSGANGRVGYTPPGREKALDHAEADLKMRWSVCEDPEKNVWPDELPGFRGASLQMHQEARACAEIVLAALELGLDLPKNALVELLKNGDSQLHYVSYFTLNGVSGPFRRAPSTDRCLITIQPGSAAEGMVVETRRRPEEPVGANRNEILVSVGDQLARLTDGFLPATRYGLKRPANGAKMTYGMPFLARGPFLG